MELDVADLFKGVLFKFSNLVVVDPSDYFNAYS